MNAIINALLIQQQTGEEKVQLTVQIESVLISILKTLTS